MDYFEQRFNESIEHLIDIMANDVYWIHVFPDIQCHCVDYDSKNPDPGCPKCLGTGHKIKIKKIQAVSNDPKQRARLNMGENLVIDREFFVRAKFNVDINDVLIDDDGKIFYVYERTIQNSFHGKEIYFKLECPIKKLDTKKFNENFHKIVGDKNA